MVAIYSTQSLPDAELLRALLLENGVESILDNQNAPIPGAAPLTVSVEESDQPLALRLLKEHQGR